MPIPEHINEYLKYIVSCIKETMPVTAIYLFGSYAKGDYNEDSDVDVFIITSDKSKRLLEYMRAVGFAIGFDHRIVLDILVGYDDDFERRCHQINFIENEVFETGVLLYASK